MKSYHKDIVSKIKTELLQCESQNQTETILK